MALSQAGEFAKQPRDLQTEVEQLGDLRESHWRQSSPYLPTTWKPGISCPAASRAIDLHRGDHLGRRNGHPIDEEDETAATSRDEVC